jgi:hypothetical protein
MSILDQTKIWYKRVHLKEKSVWKRIDELNGVAITLIIAATGLMILVVIGEVFIPKLNLSQQMNRLMPFLSAIGVAPFLWKILSIHGITEKMLYMFFNIILNLPLFDKEKRIKYLNDFKEEVDKAVFLSKSSKEFNEEMRIKNSIKDKMRDVFKWSKNYG